MAAPCIGCNSRPILRCLTYGFNQAIFLEELRRNPENGWSLFGLEQALRAQGRKRQADDVADRFQRSWQNADIELNVATL